MSTKFNKWFLFLLFFLISGSTFPQNEKSENRLFLFTDRDYCVAGDTVWFKVALQNFNDSKSDVVRVQFSDAENRLISMVKKQFHNQWAEGYLVVPDTMGTGLYFLSAFLNEQRTEPGFILVKKALYVFNRFQRDLTEFPVPDEKGRLEVQDFNEVFSINPGRKIYTPREKVDLNFSMDTILNSEISFILVKASRVDKFFSRHGGWFSEIPDESGLKIPHFQENAGVLISGKVTTEESDQPVDGAVVFLSVLKASHHLDYYISGTEGDFHFYLKQAEGRGEVVLQAFTKTGRRVKVHPENVPLLASNPNPPVLAHLQENNIGFIHETIDAAFFTKLFKPELFASESHFDFPPRFKMPFYGYPHKQIFPGNYIDLPDFREIARELLPGVQYRIRNDNVSLRMLHLKENIFFSSEPFKMVNGIPVFRNRLISSFGSTDIDRVEYVMEDRIYGDLRFSGTLAIFLKNSSVKALTNQPGFFTFTETFLQPENKPGYLIPEAEKKNIPDFRQVVCFQLIEPGRKEPVVFFLPDVKGEYEISAEGITSDGRIFKSSKIIEVR
jgi:hypothetical protein